QEPIAGVDRLRAGGTRRLDDAFAAQVAVFRRGAADVHRLVAGLHVLGIGVGVGVHGDRADAELARGGGNAAGDFAAVGDQDLGEHACLRIQGVHTTSLSTAYSLHGSPLRWQ